MALLEAPPAVGKYNTLKAFLKKPFELSELEKADHLLSLNGLGDSKLSELMERMLAVLGSADPHIFLWQLPAPVCTALACCALRTTVSWLRKRIFLASRQQFVHMLFPTHGA